jgi:hypothetical protein
VAADARGAGECEGIVIVARNGVALVEACEQTSGHAGWGLFDKIAGVFFASKIKKRPGSFLREDAIDRTGVVGRVATISRGQVYLATSFSGNADVAIWREHIFFYRGNLI